MLPYQFDRLPSSIQSSSTLHQKLTAQKCFTCPLATCRVTVQPGGPSAQNQASMLYNAWLLDMPKLLDIAVLYGRDNPALVQQLMHKVRRSCEGMISAVMTSWLHSRTCSDGMPPFCISLLVWRQTSSLTRDTELVVLMYCVMWASPAKHRLQDCMHFSLVPCSGS